MKECDNCREHGILDSDGLCAVCGGLRDRTRRETLREVKQEMSRLIEKRGAIQSWTGLCQWLHAKLDESEKP